jgi:hypothetical protein
MKCPHCFIDFHEKPLVKSLVSFSYTIVVNCSKCKKYSIYLIIADQYLEDETVAELMGLDSSNIDYTGVGIRLSQRTSRIETNNTNETEKINIIYKGRVYPKGCSFPISPLEVPKEIAIDYNEACLVLTDSPNASAALSRRCLQNLIRKVCDIKEDNLKLEIDHFNKEMKPPNYIIQNLHYLREIGNYSAHPIKDKNTGLIIPIDPEEAEWNLIVLHDLFDFCYVQPAVQKKRREKHNEKWKKKKPK